MELIEKLKRSWIATLWVSGIVTWALIMTVLYQQQMDRQQRLLSVLQTSVPTQLSEDGVAAQYAERLQPLFALSDELLAVSLSRGGVEMFSYPAAPVAELLTGSQQIFILDSADGMQLQVYLRPPLAALFAAVWWWLMLLGALLLFILPVYFIIRYVNAHWQGVVLLQLRGRQILKGEFVLCTGSEYPYEVAEALDLLQQQLKSARQERRRFDQFIRDSTFTDLESGFGNRRFFDNRLEALLRDSEVNDGGAVYLLQLQELDRVKEQMGEEISAELIVQFSQILGQLLANQSDVVIARRSAEDFAALVPNLIPREVEELANKLMRGVRRLVLPDCVDRDCFIHIGVARYAQGDDAYQVLSEADMALRAAQLQGPSCWFMYDRGVIERGHALGSVRWRALLENAIARRSFVMFTQSAVTASASRIHHHEVLTRVRDDKGQLVSAGVFLPMASRCGLLPKIDRLIIEQLIKLLEYERSESERCSINVSCDSLLDHEFMQWLVATLKHRPHIAQRMIIEVSEYHVHHHQQAIEQPLSDIRNTGCQLLVDRVGQTVVGSQYIARLHIDCLKLHQSIVRDIHQRPENQLFLRSLTGSLAERPVQIFALGVETEAEWRMLKNLGVYGGQGHFFSESLERVAACSS